MRPSRAGRPGAALAGLDVLVEAEEVGRVVGALELDQPVVLLGAVGLSNAVGALVAEEVDVDAVARVGLQGVEEVARPGDVPVALWVVLGPDGVDDDVVRSVALAERGCVLWHATKRPAELEDDGV